jgi:hypothetical protein
MKLSLSGVLAGCLVLAVASAVAKVIALLIILALLAAIITRPREMIALATTLGVLNLVALYPLPAFGLAGCLLAYRLRNRGSRGEGSKGEPVKRLVQITRNDDSRE